MANRLSLVPIGTVSKTLGYDGTIVLHLNEDYIFSKDLRFVFLHIDGLPVPFSLRSYSVLERSLQVLLTGIYSKEEAAKFKGSLVSIEEGVVDKQEDETEWLVGYTVESNGIAVGIISKCINHGLSSLIDVDRYDGSNILLPIHNDLILSIDSDRMIVNLEIVEGLLDLK
jgi:16S rRNA processing protein RimM